MLSRNAAGVCGRNGTVQIHDVHHFHYHIVFATLNRGFHKLLRSSPSLLGEM